MSDIIYDEDDLNCDLCRDTKHCYVIPSGGGVNDHQIDLCPHCLCKEIKTKDARIAELEAALAPFTICNSSEEFIEIKVKTARVTRARAALTPTPPKP